MEELEIHEDPSSHSKHSWKILVKAKVHLKNSKDLKNQLSTYTKLDVEKLRSEEYEEKDYLRTMNVSSGRTMFSARSSMLSTIQWNFKGNPRYRANNYLCKCGDRDTQSSLLNCTSYKHLRDGLNVLHSDSDLVKYYQLVIEERRKEEREQE